MLTGSIPLPPVPMRRLVGPITDDSYFDNPTGEEIWGPLAIGPLAPGEAYEYIFDFGCGCGREARRLLLQRNRPKAYVGIDIHRMMIQWCQENLQAEGFSFHHHDVWSVAYAPENSRNRYLPIADLGVGFTLMEANSVFTHLHDDQTEFYLRQMYSMLAPKGIIRASFFFFNKKWFPIMEDYQHTIFVNEHDTTQAVFYDWDHFRVLTQSLGFRIASVEWTKTLGFHNIVILAKAGEFPDVGDTIPPGTVLGF